MTERGGLRFLFRACWRTIWRRMCTLSMQPAAFSFYHSGVYREGEDMVAAAKVRSLCCRGR